METNNSSAGSGGRERQVLSPPVEAVVQFNYPSDLVLSVYRQLRVACARSGDSRHAQSPSPAAAGNGEAAMTGTGSNVLMSSRPHAVSAATLLMAVEDALHGRRGDANTTVGAGVGVESAGSSFSAAVSSSSSSAPDAGARLITAELQHGMMSGNEKRNYAHGGGEVAERYVEEDGDETPPSASQQQSPEGQQQPPAEESPAESATTPSSSSSGTNAAGDTVRTHPNASGPDASAEPAHPPTQDENTPSSSTSQSPPESMTDSRDRSPQRGSEENAPAAAAAAAGAVGAGAGAAIAAPTGDNAGDERRRQLNRLRALRAENRRLKARQTCRQCREKAVALTLLPCGHFCLCEDCGPSFETCPVCRKTVLADVKTFVS